jgi:hypothetical protein
MNKQMELFEDGGLKDEGGMIDKESGNEVPVGGTRKGVRDNIPAMISEGEFVFPEDVTRYIGLDKLMQLRQEAKIGLKRMEAMGQMGNSDEATIPDDLPFGMEDLIIVEVSPEEKDTKKKMQVGGLIDPRDTAQTGTVTSGATGTVAPQGGTVIRTPAPATAAQTPTQQQPSQRRSTLLTTAQVKPQELEMTSIEDVMGEAAIVMKEYRNAAGQTLIVPFIDGKPIFPIPEGYTLYEGGEPVGDTQLPVEGIPQTGGTPQRDDDDRSSSRQMPTPEAIIWEELNDDDFLAEANGRMGFGRTLAVGIATAINPIMGVAIGGLMRYEDSKVLELAKERLKAGGLSKQQRAEYTALVEKYEAKNKGLLGGLLSKVIDSVGNMLGLTKEQKVKAQKSGLIQSIRPKLRPDGIVSQADANELASNTNTLTLNDGTTIQVSDYLTIQANLASSDPEVANAAAVALGNIIVNSNSTVDAIAVLGEEARIDLVNIAYKPASQIKDILDSAPDALQQALGYQAGGLDPAKVLEGRQTTEEGSVGRMAVEAAVDAYGINNYLDVADTIREEVSSLLPPTIPRTEAGTIDLEAANIPSFTPTRDFTQLPTTSPVVVPKVLETMPYTSAMEGPAGQPVSAPTTFVEPTQTGLEALEAPMPAAISGYDEAPVTATTTPVARSPSDFQYASTTSTSVPTTQEQTAEDYSATLRAQGIVPTEADMEAAGFSTSVPSTATTTAGISTYDAIPTGEELVMSQPVAPARTDEEVVMSQPVAPAQQPETQIQTSPNLVYDRDAVSAGADYLQSGYEEAAFGGPTPPVESAKVESTLSFDDAFAQARAAGESTFTYDGSSFTTETSEEKQDREQTTTTASTSGRDYMPAGAGYTTIDGRYPNAEERQEQRDAAHAAASNDSDPQAAVNQVVATQRDDDSGSQTTTTSTSSSRDTSTSSRDTNVASSGRTETQVQADINAALDASGGDWTEELNDLVSERDSARSNEGSSGGDSGGDSGGSDDGTHCCTASQKRGDMTLTEVKKLRSWHRQQSIYWQEGYDIWGKVIADHLVAKSKWQSDRVRDFYNHKIYGKLTLGSVYADIVIYPMSYIIGLYKVLSPKIKSVKTTKEI